VAAKITADLDDFYDFVDFLSVAYLPPTATAANCQLITANFLKQLQVL